MQEKTPQTLITQLKEISECNDLPLKTDFTKFLSFIVFIINNLDLQTTVSDKTEIVINAAKAFLDIQSVTTKSILALLEKTSV